MTVGSPEALFNHLSKEFAALAAKAGAAGALAAEAVLEAPAEHQAAAVVEAPQKRMSFSSRPAPRPSLDETMDELDAVLAEEEEVGRLRDDDDVQEPQPTQPAAAVKAPSVAGAAGDGMGTMYARCDDADGSYLAHDGTLTRLSMGSVQAFDDGFQLEDDDDDDDDDDGGGDGSDDEDVGGGEAAGAAQRRMDFLNST